MAMAPPVSTNGASNLITMSHTVHTVTPGPGHDFPASTEEQPGLIGIEPSRSRPSLSNRRSGGSPSLREGAAAASRCPAGPPLFGGSDKLAAALRTKLSVPSFS
jgi:hypothetical protein